MKDIYSQSACTIAATAAHRSEEGLFYDRQPVDILPFCLTATWTRTGDCGKRLPYLDYSSPGMIWVDQLNSWESYVELAPLNQRAWVAQERQLSPRTMHFGATQLFWECHELKASEIYTNGLPGWAMPQWTNNASVLKTKLHDFYRQNFLHHVSRNEESYRNEVSLSVNSLEVDELYFAWSSFQICYSAYRMTKEEDKLVALRGISKDLEQALDDQFLAGLWRNRFVEELCWFVYPYDWEIPAAKPSKWRAPSW